MQKIAPTISEITYTSFGFRFCASLIMLLGLNLILGLSDIDGLLFGLTIINKIICGINKSIGVRYPTSFSVIEINNEKTVIEDVEMRLLYQLKIIILCSILPCI